MHEDRQCIGRIRYARERVPGLWLWHIMITIPGTEFGDAKSLDQAKERFKEAWGAFKYKHGPEALAKAFDAMNYANRPGRYRRRRLRCDDEGALIVAGRISGC